MISPQSVSQRRDERARAGLNIPVDSRVTVCKLSHRQCRMLIQVGVFSQFDYNNNSPAATLGWRRIKEYQA